MILCSPRMLKEAEEGRSVINAGPWRTEEASRKAGFLKYSRHGEPGTARSNAEAGQEAMGVSNQG